MTKNEMKTAGTIEAPAYRSVSGGKPFEDRGGLTSRERFLEACHCRPVDRPPVWLMRQAGRCLPEYRALKEHYNFIELVQTPDLAAEVTLQPIHRFGFDAAIIFSDILTVPEALGQAYGFREGGGVKMEFRIETEADVAQLEVEGITERLQYMAESIRLVRNELGAERALLGFAGSPWTLANFMMEGGSVREFTRAKSLYFNSPKVFDQLCEKLTRAVIDFLNMQIDAGVDAVQLFDSHGGLLAAHSFESGSGRWIKEIITGLKGAVPVIVFSKGTHGNWQCLAQTGAQALGIDWAVSLKGVRSLLPQGICLQGNLDPAVLNSHPKRVASECRWLLEEMRGEDGYIFNLGHGVPPTAKLENIEALVTTVREFV